MTTLTKVTQKTFSDSLITPNSESLKSCFGEISVDDFEDNLTKDRLGEITAKFIYLKPSNREKGAPITSSFVDYIKSKLIYLCIPPKVIKDISEKYKDDESMKWLKLNEKVESVLKSARKSDKKNNTTGELGELILSALLECYYQAPIIAHKIYHKFNKDSAIQGNDGIHACLDHNEKLCLIYLESKMEGDRGKAISNALESIKTYKERKGTDLQAIAEIVNVKDKDFENKLIDHLNTWNERHKDTRELNVAFACFDSNIYQNLYSYPETQYEEILTKNYLEQITKFKDKVDEVIGDDIDYKRLEIHFIVLPTESVFDLQKLCSFQGINFAQEKSEKVK